MSKIKNLIILVLIFFAGVSVVISFRFFHTKKSSEPLPTHTQQSQFSFKVPSEALKGKLIDATGVVEKKPRDKDEFEVIVTDTEILQGENLETKEYSSAIVEFLNFTEITINPNSKISFINLIPDNFLIEQTSGSIKYVAKENKTVNMRALHALISLYPGEAEITINEDQITIAILSGSAKLAIVDLENNTNVWNLKEGQTVFVNDTERLVEIE